ncbi:MAG: hypothetical protein M1832_001826 [Thelocarpon impressellum]|nr:MAG: hypothetical protein M1832_001826 [Thelocarpon impressellum]
MGDSSDESPLYLFDSRFVEKLGLAVGREAAGGYWAPECFGEDLFAVLDQKRPDCRWLIIGPERSGSTFHKDPNATSAWNAVIRGAKYWIMFPPSKASPPPPGVFVSADQSEVTSPLSIAEWLLGFHAEARKTKGCVEGICTAGEVLHVPSGWWHLVVNLAPSIAITQNFIPRQHLRAALSFLRDRPSQVSGFAPDVADPFRAFVEGLRSKGYGDLLGETLAGMERGGLGVGKMKRKRRWDEVVNGADEKDEIGGGGGDGFSFSFAGADDDDVP